MSRKSAAILPPPVDHQSTPIPGGLLRIPVGRKIHGPGGLDWFIDAVFSDGPGNAPAFLLRPCVRVAFVPGQIRRLRDRKKSAIEELLLRPWNPVVHDPLSREDAALRLQTPREQGSLFHLRDVDIAPGDRRVLIEREPWTLLLDDPPEALGMGELAGMDPVDAALLALMDAHCSPHAGGRPPSGPTPNAHADLVDILIDSGMSVINAAALVSTVPGAPSETTLARLRESAGRTRRQSLGPVVVPDEASTGLDLQTWLRKPRTARLLRVISGGLVGGLHIGLSDPPTIDGWMESRTLPFRAMVVAIEPGKGPPMGLSPDDIDADARTMTRYGFAETDHVLRAREYGSIAEA